MDNYLGLQKSIYQNLKKRALSYEGKGEKSLQQYRRDQKKYSQQAYSESNIDELLSSIKNSQVVYLGDFHTYDQNSKNFLRIIRTLIKSRTKFTIALEMIYHRDNFIIESYLKDNLTEFEFLEEINYHEAWRFPWTHYKNLFDEAKKHHLNIIGLNSEGSLEKRDQYASTVIANQIDNDPATPILVLFGELHVLPNRIPRLVSEKTQDVTQTIIHQNIDDIFWKLHEKGRSTNNSVVKFSPHEFCLVTSPPWLKYESMIYWYENLIDDPEYDIHELLIEKGLKTFGNDAIETFSFLYTEICRMFETQKIKCVDVDVNLYDHTNLDYFAEEISEMKSPLVRKFYEKQLSNNHSFQLPDDNKIYCGNYSFNKLAKLTGRYHYNQQLVDHHVGVKNILTQKNKIKKIVYFTFLHLHGHLFAKMVNPHIKCDMYKDYEKKIKISKKKSQVNIYQNILGALDCFFDEKKIPSNLYDLNFIGQALGEIIAENLLIHQKAKEPDYIKTLAITYDDPTQANFEKIIKKVLPNNLYRLQKKRIF